jgi:hypothetical protein
MALVERHKSPDGLLELVVDLTDGDWTIGFAGYPFHTHGDILVAWGYEGPPQAVTRMFVDDIISSRRPIVVWRKNGTIRDFDVPPVLDRKRLAENIAKYGSPDESVEARYWNGQQAAE